MLSQSGVFREKENGLDAPISPGAEKYTRATVLIAIIVSPILACGGKPMQMIGYDMLIARMRLQAADSRGATRRRVESIDKDPRTRQRRDATYRHF